jgi:hypothetical protein|nr:MAG TPA: hypothetical protein [Caudoviricetes sp.]
MSRKIERSERCAKREQFRYICKIFPYGCERIAVLMGYSRQVSMFFTGYYNKNVVVNNTLFYYIFRLDKKQPICPIEKTQN